MTSGQVSDVPTSLWQYIALDGRVEVSADPQAYGPALAAGVLELVGALQPGDDTLLRRLADVLAEPAASVCRSLADEVPRNPAPRRSSSRCCARPIWPMFRPHVAFEPAPPQVRTYDRKVSADGSSVVGMSQTTVPVPHPVVRCVRGIGSELDRVDGSDPVYLTAEEKVETLTGLTREIARLEGLRAAVLAASEDVAESAGARSAGAWLAHAARLDPAEGRRLQRLAEALDGTCALTGAALRSGDVSREQTAVIVGAMEELPAAVGAEVRERAEARLVADASEFNPKRLRVLSRRILDLVAPEVAEDHERRALAREEARARVQMRITTRDLGGGLSRAVVDLPTAVMDRWLTQLHAFASPRRDHLAEGESSGGGLVAGEVRTDPDTGERVRYPRLLAQAFCTMLERLPAPVLPQHGGGATTLVVTLDLAGLVEGLGSAELATGGKISAGEARRLACNAQIVPAVLGGKSEVLDLGRARRLFSPAQRKALTLRDRQCRAEDCDTPAAWTEAHHLRPWSAGGRTDLDDGVLLCSWHHHRAHDARYDYTRTPNGDLRFHRRT